MNEVEEAGVVDVRWMNADGDATGRCYREKVEAAPAGLSSEVGVQVPFPLFVAQRQDPFRHHVAEEEGQQAEEGRGVA